jgi:hypothetical protein
MTAAAIVSTQSAEFRMPAKLLTLRASASSTLVVRWRQMCLQACLQMDPDKRPTCEQLLQLPYFAGAAGWFTPEFHGHQVPRHATVSTWR